MTKRTPKLPVADDLQRRISDAMGKEHGLAGDAELTALLASDAGAQAYAKDLSRIDMWLASWPVPEPSDDAMEALATRIEQRLGENLPGAMSSFLNEPDFADDDSLRDAAASILTAGAAPKPTKATLVGVPSPVGAKPAVKAPLIVAKPVGVPKPGAAPLKPTATKVDTKLEAKPEPAKVEPAKVEPANVATKAETKPETANPKLEPVKLDAAKPAKAEPAKPTQPEAARPAKPTAPVEIASVEIADELDLKPENSGEIERISLVPEPISVPEIPAARALPPKPKKKRKSDAPPANKGAVDDRISIPLPAPAPLPPLTLAAPPSLGAPRSVPPANDRKRAFWPMLAAAAVVGLAVAVGGPFLLSESRHDDAPSVVAVAEPAEGAAEESRAEAWAAPVTAVAPSAPAAAPPPATVAPPEITSLLAEAPAEAAADEGRADGEGDALAAAGPLGVRGADGVARARRAAAPGAVAAERPVSLGALGGAATTGSSGAGSSGAVSSGTGRGGTSTGTSAAPATRTPSRESREAGGGRARAAATPSGPLPEAPSRDAARDVLDGVAPQVYACFGEEHGLAEVAVIVASSGRVTTSTVSGRFAGTPVGSCIARAIRGARFPAFTNPRFEVHYEYRH